MEKICMIPDIKAIFSLDKYEFYVSFHLHLHHFSTGIFMYKKCS